MRSHLTSIDRKSTRLNSSHLVISYAVFCLKKNRATTIVFTAHPRFLVTDARPPQGRAVRAGGAALIVFAVPPRVRVDDCANHFFFNDTATTEIYPLSLHDALPI